jgi:hypothetical protein
MARWYRLLLVVRVRIPPRKHAGGGRGGALQDANAKRKGAGSEQRRLNWTTTNSGPIGWSVETGLESVFNSFRRCYATTVVDATTWPRITGGAQA